MKSQLFLAIIIFMTALSMQVQAQTKLYIYQANAITDSFAIRDIQKITLKNTLTRSEMQVYPKGGSVKNYSKSNINVMSFTPYALPQPDRNAVPYADASVQIFPNPTTGKLTIGNRQLPMNQISIYNIFGIVVAKYVVTDISAEIDISHLPKGLYYLQIRNADGMFTKKIVKQ